MLPLRQPHYSSLKSSNRSGRHLSGRQANLWVFECSEYGLSAFSADRAEALQQLHEGFAFLYDGLVSKPDSASTPDAITLRADVKETQSLT